MYHIFEIQAKDSMVDILLALIGARIDIEGVSYHDDGFSFYIPESIEPDTVKAHLNDIGNQFEFSYSIDELEDKNWNLEWESSFNPVEVHQFCRVRAPFHEPSKSFQHDLIIHPGMAFGTGHHETTWMMINAMKFHDLQDKNVLDAGCGTGVLAILASREGAKKIDAFDYDVHSVESTTQNMQLNDCENINVVQSEALEFQGGPYDLILANINRNVILSVFPKLVEILAYKGMIIVSGYLVDDIELIEQAAKQENLKLLYTQKRGDWVCQTFN
ncbi:MAG: 50S ribosomal protein L11 methyltransferase [Bacteroidia bacterium]|nr:50S ribosomal protein L11 methyltransferase [Bacteroidia bacterium]